MAVSAASASDDPGLYYNDVDMEDMTQLDREEAGMATTTTWGKLPRRTEKLGKAFQNWRRVQMKFLADMQKKKIVFMTWRQKDNVCMQDWIWTEDDMDHFLHTVASFETHKRLWNARRQERDNPSHKHHGKQMPRMIPPSYVRLFQITLSQTHSSKFRQHFGAAVMDGTLDEPFKLLWHPARWMSQLR